MSRKPRVAPSFGHASVSALAVSPDGKLLASGDEYGRVLLWDLPADTPPRVLRPPSVRTPPPWLADAAPRRTMPRAVDDLVFTPEGLAVAIAGVGTELWRIDPPGISRVLPDLDAPITSDANLLWGWVGTILTRANLTTGETHPVRDLPSVMWPPRVDALRRRVASVEDGMAVLWDIDTGSPAEELVVAGLDEESALAPGTATSRR